VPFRLRCLRVEPRTVVAKDELDLIAVLANREPHMRRAGVLQRVHHGFPTDVIHEQRDRRRQLHVFELHVELDV
jgi:hypothetical protein